MGEAKKKPDWRNDPRVTHSPEEAAEMISDVENAPDEFFPVLMENGGGAPSYYSKEDLIEMIRANTRDGYDNKEIST